MFYDLIHKSFKNSLNLTNHIHRTSSRSVNSLNCFRVVLPLRRVSDLIAQSCKILKCKRNVKSQNVISQKNNNSKGSYKNR